MVIGEGDEAGDAGGVVLAHHAGQLAARARSTVGIAVEEHQRAFAETVVAVMRHLRRLPPAPSAILRQRQDLGELLAVGTHEVGQHCQLSVAQLQHPVRLEAHDPGLLCRPPGAAVIVAPPGQVGGRLIGVEVTIVIAVAQDHQPAIAEPAQARGDQPLFTGLQVGARHLGLLAPGAAAVVAGQQRQDDVVAGPVAVGVGVHQEHAARWQADQIGVLGETSGTVPRLERRVVKGMLGNLHRNLVVLNPGGIGCSR